MTNETNEQVETPDIDTMFADEVINAEQINQTIRDSGAPAGTQPQGRPPCCLSIAPSRSGKAWRRPATAPSTGHT